MHCDSLITSRALRSSAQKLLEVPFLSTDFGRCTFSYSSPATWNSVPTSIKNCSSLYSCKRHLKPSSLTINILRPATWRLLCLRFMLNASLCARYKLSFFLIIITCPYYPVMHLSLCLAAVHHYGHNFLCCLNNVNYC